MRLLLVYDCVYPEVLGGIEHRNHQLARALAARGHHVDVAGWASAPREIAPGARVVPLPWSGGPPPVLEARRRAADALRFATAVRRLPLAGYDVVETANIPFSHLLPLAARCRRLGLPLLVTWHEVWGRYWRDFLGWPLWPLAAAVEVGLAQLGDTTVAVSPLTTARLGRLRGRSRVLTVPNGVPVAAVRAAAADQAPGPPLVYAGRLFRDKQVDLLLRAVAVLVETGTAVSGPLLTVIGDGPQRGELEALAAELGIAERVRFLGLLPTPEDVWAALGTARVAVQPSRREGFGMFPLEAMAAGLPVVYCSSPSSAVEGVVRDNLDGLLVAPDPVALAASLDMLLDAPEVRDRLAASARERAESYDWSAVAARMEEVFASLAARAGRR